MNGIIAAIIGLGGLVLVNLAFAILSYGRLLEQVKNLCMMIKRQEAISEAMEKRLRIHGEQISRLETLTNVGRKEVGT